MFLCESKNSEMLSKIVGTNGNVYVLFRALNEKVCKNISFFNQWGPKPSSEIIK